MSQPILVTASAFDKGREVFQKAEDLAIHGVVADETALAAEVLARGARAVVVGSDPYRGPLYQALARTAAGGPALLARFGVGHDNVDKGLARENGILVTNTPGVLEDSVAEHTLWLIGNLAKQITLQHQRLCQGAWDPTIGMELRGKALAVVGFGAIGRRVAAAAHFGFGMHVIAVGRYAPADFQQQLGQALSEFLAALGVAEYTDSLSDAASRADVITLHLPATATTRHIVNRQSLDLFNPKALLINTARGALIDEAALYEFLAARRLAAAGLDVFENEPYRPVLAGKDLRDLDNVVMTPHTGSNTLEANARMASSVLESVRNFLDGKFDQLPRVDIAD
jgi:lactate dehydrogenase-like 2-hydroxyacid dehydrogenase